MSNTFLKVFMPLPLTKPRMASQFTSLVKESAIPVDDFVHDEPAHVTLDVLDIYVGERCVGTFDPPRLQ